MYKTGKPIQPSMNLNQTGSLGLKLGIGGGAMVLVIGLIVFMMSISYQNSYERIGEDILSQYKKIETDYDKKSRIILQQAGIAKKFTSEFRGIYKDMMTSRYGSEGSKAAFQWIKEQNPQLSDALYAKLMTTVEAQHTAFSRKQEKVAMMVAESNKMLKTAPSKWFVDGEIKEAKIVSSSNTKVIMETGIDDSSNDLFN